jgi:hypothetical protein
MDRKREIEIKTASLEILKTVEDLTAENLILKSILDTAEQLGRPASNWKTEAAQLENSPGAMKVHSRFAPISASIREALDRDTVFELLAQSPELSRRN